MSSSVSLSTNTVFNSHNSKVTFFEFNSLQSKTGDKVSLNPVTLRNNQPANNLSIIYGDMKKFLHNKRNISTFYPLKNVSYINKLNLMEVIFIPDKSFVFPKKSDEKGDRPFQHSCLELLSWLYYCLIQYGAYYMYCVLFMSGSSGKKIRLFHTLFNTRNDVLRCFRRHSEL